MRSLVRLCVLLAWGLCTAPSAHEIQDNRATLVLRAPTHLVLTLYVDYAGIVHRVLAPGRSYDEFLLVHAAMGPEEFRRQLERAQARLEAGTRVGMDGSEMAMTGWSWPDPLRVQEAIRGQVMATMVGGGHAHEQPFEIRAEITSRRDITGASLRLADEFGRVLVVWYRPQQVWLEAAQPSPPLRFP